MKRFFKILLIIGLLLGHNIQVLISQSLPVTESQVRAELGKRGISEADLMAALKTKGIEVTDLNDLTPAQILELESVIQELENKNKSISDTVPPIIPKEEFLETPTAIDEENLNKLNEKQVEENVTEEIIPPTNIYGHEFFQNKNLSLFEKSSEVKAPDSYILGAGDKIVVSIWGISQSEYNFEIDKEGYVQADRRRIFLKGISLGRAKSKLRDWFSSTHRFNAGEFDVALSYSRTINVNIQGEVVNPGGYTISAINNVYNVLMAANGPSKIGSLRDILLIKKDGKVINLDFYAYIKNPSIISETTLEEGDVVVVPVAKKLVSIAGGVKRPMIYEMKDTERLGDLIALSGGFAQNAKQENLHVLRFEGNSRIIKDVSNNEIQTYSLVDGDAVTVDVILLEAENFVEVQGYVLNQGKLQRFDNMTLADAVKLSGLRAGSRKDLAFVRRIDETGKVIYFKVNLQEGSSDLDEVLIDKDQISIFALARYVDNQDFFVNGAIRNPGSFSIALNQEISIKDAIELAGGLRRDASGIAIIHTVDPLNNKVKTYRRVNLADAFSNTDDFMLSALDNLEIFSKSVFDERSEVRISGAVNNPGEFQYGNEMVLADVLTMAGGFKLAAATNRIEISRLLIQDNIPTKTIIANLNVSRDIMGNSDNLNFALQPYDEIMVRFVPEFEVQKVISLTGEVKYPGLYSLIKENETILDVIERAGGLTEEAFPKAANMRRFDDDLGFVILKLDEVIDNRNSPFNFILKDGDVISIPKSKDFVNISGATNAREMVDDLMLGAQNSLNVPFHSGKNAKFYIKNYAGGISKSGNPNDIFVENANGQISKTKNYFLFKKYPEVEKGSKILVGYKPVKSAEEKDREDVDWTKILGDSVAQAVSVLTLLLLIQRI